MDLIFRTVHIFFTGQSSFLQNMYPVMMNAARCLLFVYSCISVICVLIFSLCVLLDSDVFRTKLKLQDRSLAYSVCTGLIFSVGAGVLWIFFLPFVLRKTYRILK